MVHEHRFDNANGVCVYDFIRQNDGTYNFRGVIPGFNQGDKLRLGPSMGFSANTEFEFIEVTSVKDSKGKFKKPENGVKSLIEGKVKLITN